MRQCHQTLLDYLIQEFEEKFYSHKTKTMQKNINKSEALKRLASAENEIKELRKIIDAPEKITDRVKSVIDACDEMGYDIADIRPWKSPINKRQEAVNAVEEMFVVTETLNEGWEADYNDGNQKKWYPIFIWDKGLGAFRFDGACYGYTGACADAGARHVFATEELARYAGTQFIDRYNKFLTK